jgi:hypothetical protein
MQPVVCVVVDALVRIGRLYQFKELVVPRPERSPKPALVSKVSKALVTVSAKVAYRLAKVTLFKALWTEVNKGVGDLSKIWMQSRFAAHDAHEARILFQACRRLPERIDIHKERLLVMTAKACAVAALVRACVRNLDLDYLLIQR